MIPTFWSPVVPEVVVMTTLVAPVTHVDSQFSVKMVNMVVADDLVPYERQIINKHEADVMIEISM